MAIYRRITISALSFLALACLNAKAQFPFSLFPELGSGMGISMQADKQVKFDYDLDFQYYFDNREFSSSDVDVMRSQTIHATKIVPAVGLRIDTDPTVSMRLMVGADFLQNMGERSRCVGNEADEVGTGFQGPQVYYRIDKLFPKGVFSASAGIYPASESEGEYSRAMVSDSTRFFDNEYEGVFFKYRSSRLYAELGLDWCGKYGQLRREQFRIFSAGSYGFNRTFSAGWAVDAGHFANSEEIRTVMDNIIGHAYVRADFAQLTGMDELSLKAGALAAYQRNRKLDSKGRIPGGGEFIITAQHRNVGIAGTLYAGGDLMPYYNQTFTSPDGRSWENGAFLYRGETFYRTGYVDAGWYGLTEIYYRPHIFDMMDLKLSVDLHFMDGHGMLGTQQKFSLIIDLDALRNPRPKFRQAGVRGRTKSKTPYGTIIL